MKPRFLADADFNRTIVHGLLRRESTVDFLTAHASGCESSLTRRFWP